MVLLSFSMVMRPPIVDVWRGLSYYWYLGEGGSNTFKSFFWTKRMPFSVLCLIFKFYITAITINYINDTRFYSLLFSAGESITYYFIHNRGIRTFDFSRKTTNAVLSGQQTVDVSKNCKFIAQRTSTIYRPEFLKILEKSKVRIPLIIIEHFILTYLPIWISELVIKYLTFFLITASYLPCALHTKYL